MSTGTATQSSSLQENKSPKRDGSQSAALYYLFEEVTKLASPIHHSFMETNSMRCDGGDEKPCPSTSFTPQVKNGQSPLKLLNLINQKCEMLQNQSEDEDHCPTLILDFGNSNVSSNPSSLEQFQDFEQPLNPERHCARKSDHQHNKGCSSEDPDICHIQAVLIENTVSVQPEKRRNTVDTPQTPELKFSVALDLGSNWTEECLSTQYSFYDFLPDPHPSKESSIHEHMTFRSNDAELPLDYNANICLNATQTLNGPLELAESQFCKSNSSFQKQPSDVQVNTVSVCEDSSEENTKPSTENSLTHCTSSEKDNGEQCTVQHSTWSSKRRKQPRPSRSASVHDPDFQGVTFRMDTEFDDSKEQCRLLITSKYSTDLPKNVKRTRLRSRSSQKFLKTSSDEDSDSATGDAKSKVCASCCTSKTPMWRDAEDGTPLCNACGIRYKKYRVRCINCWHIPKKDGNSVSCCSKCGHFVRLTFSQKRPTI